MRWHGSPIIELTSGRPLLCCQGHWPPACHSQDRSSMSDRRSWSWHRKDIACRVEPPASSLTGKSSSRTHLRAVPVKRDGLTAAVPLSSHAGSSASHALTLGLTLLGISAQLANLTAVGAGGSWACERSVTDSCYRTRIRPLCCTLQVNSA